MSYLVADPGRQTGSHVPVWTLGLSGCLLPGSDYSEHGVFLRGWLSVCPCMLVICLSSVDMGWELLVARSKPHREQSPQESKVGERMPQVAEKEADGSASYTA